VLAQEGEASAPENLSQDELDAQVMAGFENLDFAALDAVDAELANQPATFDEFVEEQPMDIPAGEALDVEQYLARAYGYEEQLRERIDAHYRRADLTSIDAAIGQLPERLSPLTMALSAQDMADWLKVYGEGHAALTDLALQIRRLDTAGEA
jgi:hypothetical protein